MTDTRWLDVIARLPAEDPPDLDALLGLPMATPPSPQPQADTPTIHSTRLWARNETLSYIGIRVTEPPADIRRTALRLASAAVERGVIPIILSPLPRTGFEPYGFRVERLPAGPPEAVTLAEAELRRFWDLALVIDLADAAGLG
jgi:hypothetical protein